MLPLGEVIARFVDDGAVATTRLTRQRLAEARKIIGQNHMGTHMTPSPLQYDPGNAWTWDNFKNMLGVAAGDSRRGWEMLDGVFAGQHADGFMPHLTYHGPSTHYFPQPDRWGMLLSASGLRTSGITNPPIAGTTMRTLFEATGNVEMARKVIPKIQAWHDWIVRNRMPSNLPDGVNEFVSIHPWEGGRDNMAEAAIALAAAPRPARPFTRLDLHHVGASQRPPSADYEGFIGLLDNGAAKGWNQLELATTGPYRLIDAGMNGLFAASADDLADVARKVGLDEIAERAAQQGRMVTESLNRRMHADGSIHSIDLVRGKEVPHTSVGLVLAASPVGIDPRAAALARKLSMPGGELHTPIGLRSLSPKDPSFDPARYWLGPVWTPTTWLAATHAVRRGELELARTLRNQVIEYANRVGFSEYAHALTFEPLGAKQFSWPATLAVVEDARAALAQR